MHFEATARDSQGSTQFRNDLRMSARCWVGAMVYVEHNERQEIPSFESVDGAQEQRSRICAARAGDPQPAFHPSE
jgi:hypothetical protein